ncbi:hypothetical protein GGX14DRAFT_636985 [Mycena pura]|uniref:Uncharacterized protein n=1 Tax=Mycena pura TaxID=153505 RepID=A0AAD6V9H1_9AGAR|nr:hypothetical protein GGX14DRAFT_636985 [Mycena pura]
MEADSSKAKKTGREWISPTTNRSVPWCQKFSPMFMAVGAFMALSQDALTTIMDMIYLAAISTKQPDYEDPHVARTDIQGFLVENTPAVVLKDLQDGIRKLVGASSLSKPPRDILLTDADSKERHDRHRAILSVTLLHEFVHTTTKQTKHWFPALLLTLAPSLPGRLVPDANGCGEAAGYTFPVRKRGWRIYTLVAHPWWASPLTLDEGESILDLVIGGVRCWDITPSVHVPPAAYSAHAWPVSQVVALRRAGHRDVRQYDEDGWALCVNARNEQGIVPLDRDGSSAGGGSTATHVAGAV